MNFSWIDLSNPVACWWIFLSTVSTINIIAWSITRKYFGKKRLAENEPKLNRLVWLSGIYVFVCAFRSVMPRADVQRICLFDTWFSSVFVGRSVATVAELSFVIQWAIVLNFLSTETKTKFAERISQIIVPIICVAECCSWFAVITTNYLGNSMEESLWGVTYTLILLAILSLLPKLKSTLLYAAATVAVGCFLYIIFMSTVDVPMYIHRLIADTASGKPYLGFVQGIRDLNTRWEVTYDIARWKTEIPWMSLYFSSAVWMSLLLCYAPFSKAKLAKYRK